MSQVHGEAFAGHRSNTVWAWIVVMPNGDEGLGQVAVPNPPGVKVEIPGLAPNHPVASRALVATSLEMVETIRPIAAELARQMRATGQGDLVLRRYDLTEDLGPA